MEELLKGGYLFEELADRYKAEISVKDIALLTKQILSTVNYLHSKKIVHRCIEPNNILIEPQKGLDTIKIIDFGTAKFFDPKKIMKEQFGDLLYKAPEIFKGKYDSGVDIWAVGVIFYQMIAGTHPFKVENDEETMENIMKGEP